jgi:glycosyltransferase involved in cell wall biosynthesis
MKIGFDGKRAFQNSTGLGNYSRSLVAALNQYYPENRYILFAPKQTSLFDMAAFQNTGVITPGSFLYKKLGALWRRRGMLKDIQLSGVELFHGLSNELPKGISRSGTRSVVTVHDLIFERFPETYHLDERYVHRWKIQQACAEADAVIAASKQTKEDLIDFYRIPAEKIAVCYQTCNPIFQQACSEEEKKRIKEKYGLPGEYFLFVSSVTARKNLVAVVKAMALLKDKMNIPLVVIGNGGKEKENVKKLAADNTIANRLVWLNEKPVSKEPGFTTSKDFPGIYQQALALVYPSVFEGFGIPLLEAFHSGLPVISSNTSSLPEVGGDAALYFSPLDIETLATHLLQASTNNNLLYELKIKGFQRSALFTAEQRAREVMQVYKTVLTK